MKRLFLLLMMLFVVVACHQAAGDWQIDADTFGPVRIGMTVKDAEKVTAKEILQEKPGQNVDEACRYAVLKGGPSNVQLMLVYDQIVRIDIRNPAYKTATGVHVGMPIDQAVSLYPNRLKVDKDKYTGYKGGKNLIVIPQDDKFHKLIIDTDGKIVTNIRLGKVPEIDYVEGCS